MSSFSEKDLLSITKSPGAQYALFDSEKSLHSILAGHADVVQQTPVTDENTFHAYSTTKTFTAAAVLKLAEHGRLRLDDEVNPLLPQFAFSGKFTIRQLLSHQAGIANPLPIPWIHLSDELFDEKGFSNQLISKNLKLRFTPGSKMSYTNVGYIILGMVIENISGIDYKTYVEGNVLKPAIKNGYISYSLSPSSDATGYHPKYSFTNLLLSFMLDKKKYMESGSHGERSRTIPGGQALHPSTPLRVTNAPNLSHWSAFKPLSVNGSPYGGLIANATGMAEYLQSLMQHQILSELSLQQLFTVQRDNMCLSWFKGRLGKLDYFCHAGGGGGYYCEIRLYPQIKTGSVLMTNRSGFSDQRMLDKIDKHFIAWN